MNHLIPYKIFESVPVEFNITDWLQEVFDEFDITYCKSEVVGINRVAYPDGVPEYSKFWIYSWARDEKNAAVHNRKTKPDINHHIDGINILNITKAESDEICQRISDLKGSIEGFIGQKIHIYQFEDEGEFIFIGTRRLGGFSNSEYSKFCDTKEY